MAMVSADSESHTGCICAVVSSAADRRFGFAVFYSDQRVLRICEYHEDSHMSRTEALLLQVQPRSCCTVFHQADDAKKIGRVAESCGVTVAQLKSSDLKLVDLEQDLLRLLDNTDGCGLSRHLEEQRQKHGMRALSALLAHGSLLSEPANFGACSLGMYPLKSLLFLDKAAFTALNLLPGSDDSLRSSTSIFGFLNRCRSAIGTRRLRRWLTQPLTSPEEITRRHDVVEAFCSAESLLRQIESHFRQVPDLEKISTRLHRIGTTSLAQKASIEDLVNLYHATRGAAEIASALDTYSGVHQDILTAAVIKPLRACVADFRNYCALVEQTIDLRQAEQRNYCINSAFDATLQQLAGVRDRVREEMEVVRQKVDADLGLQARGNEKCVSLVDSPEGQALRVTKKHQTAVTGAGKGKYKTLSIKKMEFIFTTGELEKLNQRLSESIAAYEKQSSQLVGKALSVAMTYRPVVDRLAECLSSLDVLASFARAALVAPCQFVRAKLDPDGKNFSVKGATHVLVVANSEKGFIANDVSMHRDNSRLHLITGPNMGGKSTYIRSIALIALLNQIGSYVPCQSAVLPIFDSIMCRVGASDMQLRGISTFMAEMLEASCILNTATERSLVIIDELGRGTSTSDGFGIAWAIARYLVEDTRCFTLFATHFHELASLEDAVPGVRNRHTTASVDASNGSLTFLYSLADGAADQSYGAHCAELAGFPSRVVESAKVRAAEFEASSDFGATHKRRRTGVNGCLQNGVNEEAASKAVSDDASVAYVMAAVSEEDFVQRALEKAASL